MSFEVQNKQQQTDLKKMGWCLILFALFVSTIAYFLPSEQTVYWLSSTGKQGFYVLSGLFVFLGLYCFGAVWRRSRFF